MQTKRLMLFAAAVGIILGYVSAYPLVFLNSWNMLLWGVVGLALGLLCVGKKRAIQVGLFYGFFLSMSFLIAGFEGTRNQIAGFAVLSLGLAIIGAIGGALSAFVGSWIRWVFTRKTPS